jgi:hypothetical protein
MAGKGGCGLGSESGGGDTGEDDEKSEDADSEFHGR